MNLEKIDKYIAHWERMPRMAEEDKKYYHANSPEWNEASNDSSR